jgi:hypothetical protein
MNTPPKSLLLLTLFGLLSILGSCSRSSTPTAPEVNLEIIPGTGVGPIKLGMTMDEVKKALGQPDARPGRPLQYLSLGLAVLPTSKDETVGAIMMGDPEGGVLVERFKGVTPKGIGMKSTRQEIIAAYGQPENTKSSTGGLEELQYDSGGTQYALRGGRVVHITLRRVRQ